MKAQRGSIGDLKTQHGSIGELKGQRGSRDNLKAQRGSIGELKSQRGSKSELKGQRGTIGEIQGQRISIGELKVCSNLHYVYLERSVSPYTGSEKNQRISREAEYVNEYLQKSCGVSEPLGSASLYRQDEGTTNICRVGTESILKS